MHAREKWQVMKTLNIHSMGKWVYNNVSTGDKEHRNNRQVITASYLIFMQILMVLMDSYQLAISVGYRTCQKHGR